MSGDDDLTPRDFSIRFATTTANRGQANGGFPTIPEVHRMSEDVSEMGVGERRRTDALPELTLKRVLKENPNIKDKMRLSSLAEVAERYLLEKEFDRMLGGKEVLSGLSEY